MATTRMEGRGNATWVGLLAAGVIVLSTPALAVASTYGEGTYGGDIYSGSGSSGTSTAGGGPCVNCGTGGGSSSVAGKSSASTTTAKASTTSSTKTPTSGGASTSTPFRCAETEPAADGLSAAGLVNLFVSLGIIPPAKAKTACDALSSKSIPSEPTTPVVGSFRFSQPLTKGMRSEEVRRLQQFLNTHGFVVTTDGLGAPGNETDLFGLLTEDAVKRFQAAYAAEILVPVGLTAPSGFFGPSSITKANTLFADS